MPKEDKAKSRSIYILEMVLKRITLDAAASFPLTGDAIDVINWAQLLQLMVIEAVRRINVPMQPKYKDLSIEEKAKKVLELTAARVEEIMKKKERKTVADAYLNLETSGPAPQPPSKPDETSEPPEKEDSEAESSSEQSGRNY